MSVYINSSNRNLPICRSLNKFLMPITLIKSSGPIHQSQKQLELITNSNFIITKHKPTSNPWNDCSSFYIQREKQINVISYRNKLRSIDPPKMLIKKNRSFSRVNTKIKCSIIRNPNPIKIRKNSLSGWV